jgi:hypothetical protein
MSATRSGAGLNFRSAGTLRRTGALSRRSDVWHPLRRVRQQRRRLFRCSVSQRLVVEREPRRRVWPRRREARFIRRRDTNAARPDLQRHRAARFHRARIGTLLSARLGWRWRGGGSVYVFGDHLLDDDFAYKRIDRRILGVPGPLGRARSVRAPNLPGERSGTSPRVALRWNGLAHTGAVAPAFAT